MSSILNHGLIVQEHQLKNHANLEKMQKAEIFRKVAWAPTWYYGEKSKKIPVEEIFLFKMAAIATSCLLLYPEIM